MKPLSAELPESSLRDGRNVRVIVEDQELRDLAISIAKQGFLSPLGAVDYGDFAVMLWGNRRRAAYRLGVREGMDMPATLPVSLFPSTLTEEEAEILTLTENLQRRDLNDVELFHAVAAFSARGLSLEEIGELLNKSRSSVCKYRSPEHCPETAKAHFLAGRLTLGQCYRISTAADPLATMSAFLEGGTHQVASKRGRKAATDNDNAAKERSARVTIPLPRRGEDMPSLGVVTITTKAGQEIDIAGVEPLLRQALRLVQEAEKDGLSVRSAQLTWKDRSSPKRLAEAAH